MAQTVSKDDSPARVERAARRHVRMARRTKKAEAIAIAERIEAPRATLDEKMDLLTTAEEAVEDAIDDWQADDQEVDDFLGSLGRKSNDWDADHPGETTYRTLFVDQSPSEVARTAREDEPDVVEKIPQRAAGLPEGHPGAALVASIGEAVERSRASHTAVLTAETRAAQAGAAVETAKLAVVQAYRDNAIDLVRAVGEALAERCFPRLRAPRKRGKAAADGPAADAS